MWSCFQDQNFSCDISFVMIDTHLHRDNGSVSSNDNWIDKLGEKWPMNDKSGDENIKTSDIQIEMICIP